MDDPHAKCECVWASLRPTPAYRLQAGCMTMISELYFQDKAPFVTLQITTFSPHCTAPSMIGSQQIEYSSCIVNIPYGQSSAKLPVILSPSHLVIWSFSHSVTRSLGHSVTRSLGHSVTQSPGHLVTWSLGHLVTRSLGHSVTLSLGYSVTWSLGHYSSIFNVATNWLTD